MKIESMKQSSEHRKNLINAIKNADLKRITEMQKIAVGKKVVLSTFLDCLMFYNCVDKQGNRIDREKQIAEGKIEVELVDPIKSDLEKIYNERYE
jgi:hypothetical protein